MAVLTAMSAISIGLVSSLSVEVDVLEDTALHVPWLQSDPTSPTFAQGYFLQAAAERGARCLDGTPPLQYHRKGTGDGVNKWFIWQEGGAWCTNVGSCAARALGGLGSTKDDPMNTSLTGSYFDMDSTVNPLMHNWNAVALRYCDGGSLMGNVDAPVTYKNQTLYFRGQQILEEQVQALLHERGMADATDVVFGGCSAGGLAVYLNCDKFASAVSAGTGGRARTTCLPDSGFFIDSLSRVHVRLVGAFETHNASSTVNSDCFEKYNKTGEGWKCFFAQWASPYIKTPTFALQSQYDGWQMGGMNSTATNAAGAVLTGLVQDDLLSSSQHGVFLDSCSHHCGSQGPKPTWGSKGVLGSLIDGQSPGAALKAWYEQGSTALANKGFYNQHRPFPCEDCCHAAPVLNTSCPASHPWAYRPAAPFDYCCATADDNSGNIGINARVNRSLRSNTCKENDWVRCPQKPCDDYNDPSRCPSSFPWAYRPDAFDFCCASADDNQGHVGVNGLVDRNKRSRSCKDDDFMHCLQAPCKDYPSEPTVV